MTDDTDGAESTGPARSATGSASNAMLELAQTIEAIKVERRRVCRARYLSTDRRCVKPRGHGGPHVAGSRSWGRDESDMRLGERVTVPPEWRKWRR